jgi:hypothetical protein
LLCTELDGVILIAITLAFATHTRLSRIKHHWTALGQRTTREVAQVLNEVQSFNFHDTEKILKTQKRNKVAVGVALSSDDGKVSVVRRRRG